MANNLMVQVNGLKEDPLDLLADESEAAREAFAKATPEQRSEIMRRVSDKLPHISPPGAFPWMSKLLDEKRISEGIVDAFFTREAATFENVYIYQLEYREVFAPNSPILMPQITQDRFSKDGPRGIIISAGPAALEVLWSNGMDVGHTITFARHAPWRITMATFSGKEEVALEMKVGDIVGSEDLQQDLIAGRTRYVQTDDGKVQVVTLERRLTPINPFSSDEAM